MTALVLGALIAAIAVFLVALPFLRHPDGADDLLDAPTEAEERRLALIEERDHALGALKELEFDHRTGKIDDIDYRAMVVPLRRAAASALQALDAHTSEEGPPEEPAVVEPEVPARASEEQPSG